MDFKDNLLTQTNSVKVYTTIWYLRKPLAQPYPYISAYFYIQSKQTINWYTKQPFTFCSICSKFIPSSKRKRMRAVMNRLSKWSLISQNILAKITESQVCLNACSALKFCFYSDRYSWGLSDFYFLGMLIARIIWLTLLVFMTIS